ncbi:MAG: translocation/assembly module TamB domain-containing protein [Vicinamibacterales bacterium]
MHMVRRLVQVLVLVLTLIVGGAAAAVIVSQTAWFKNWLRGYIVSEAHTYLNGDLTIERLGGNLFFGVELENIAITVDGSEVVAIRDLGLDYNLFQLIAQGLVIDDIRLNRPTVYLRREGDTWSIARLIKEQAQEADREGPQAPISIGEIGISDGAVILEDPIEVAGLNVPERVDRIDARLGFEYEPVRYSVEIAHVSFRTDSPAMGLNALSGGLAVRDDTVFVDTLAMRTEESSLTIDGSIEDYLGSPRLKLQVTSDKLSVPEIARLVPALAGIDQQPAFEIAMNGPLDRLGVDVNVRASAGQVASTLVMDLQEPGQAVQGDVRVRGLDLSALTNDPALQSDLTADLQADLRADTFTDLDSLRGSLGLTARHIAVSGYSADDIAAKAELQGRRASVDASASAYGARATVDGDVVLPLDEQPLTFDVRGRAANIDLRRMPAQLGAPKVPTALTADYHATGTIPRDAAARRIAADATFADSTVPGLDISQGSQAGVTLDGEKLSYRLDARVAHVNLQELGNAFDVPALADARAATSLAGHVTANGSGTTLPELDVRAEGTLEDSAALGGRIPRLTFDAGVAGGNAQVSAEGSFSDLDMALASGRDAMEGRVTGRLDVDARIEGFSDGVTPANVTATAQVNLEPSTLGGLAIERASVDADYHDLSAEIRQLEVAGRDINATAEGTLVLNETGESDLRFHVDSPRIQEIAALFELPLSGIVKVEGRVAGNRAELQASGNLVANGLEYDENGALMLNTDYRVRVPDLDVDRASVDADAEATFVTIAGQNINEVTAQATYARREVQFRATAEQPERTLAAGGAVVLHPDHQELHLTQLALVAGQHQWNIPAGSEPTVSYGGGAIEISAFQLVSGEQRIAVDGTLGRPGATLDVTLARIDLPGVEALLLREPQFSGQLNATAAVGGTTDALDVRGEFQVAQGGFREFSYDTFGGTVAYDGAGLTLDTRLQQNATQWITASGYVPTALFSSAEADPSAVTEGGHIPPASDADRVDLTIDSSTLDLGLIQGFTGALDDVAGTLETHVHVTGSARDPHPSGDIRIADGSLTVVPTGVAYSHINGTVELQPDRVHVEQITILDNHQSALSLTGDLGVHALEVGGFQIWINAEDFKVIDNDMGEIRIQSAMSLQGRLRSPMVQGYLGITTGDINLDEVIAAVASSPYSTEEAGYDSGGTVAALADAPQEAPQGAPFDALRMNIDFIIPNDLVVKADSLQTPGSPVSLGSLNVTLGGELTITKEPAGPVRLVGPINTVRGTYDFQGRRFDILRDGSIRFDGLEELNPRLDLRTRRVIQGVEARVNIRGNLRSPEIVLTSVPPLEPADILALIVFNQPVNQLGQGQQVSLAQRAQSIAAGAVAGQLAQSIGGALNLDTFEINVAPESGRGPELTVGQQVGQNLYVRVQQGIGNQTMTNFVLEYEITDWLRLQTNVVQGSSTQQSLFRRNQGSGADLIFTFSY